MKQEKNQFQVIKEPQVNTPKSMLTMKKGEPVTVACSMLAPYGTVKSAATRLNQRAGKREFVVTSPVKGATIVSKRN